MSDPSPFFVVGTYVPSKRVVYNNGEVVGGGGGGDGNGNNCESNCLRDSLEPQQQEEQPFAFHSSRLSRSAALGVWTSVGGEGGEGPTTRTTRGSKRVGGSSIGGRRTRITEMGERGSGGGEGGEGGERDGEKKTFFSAHSSRPRTPSPPLSPREVVVSPKTSPRENGGEKEEGGKKRKQLKLFQKKSKQGGSVGVFGRPIEDLQGDGLVPLVMLHCIKYLTRTQERLETEGLFRVSANYRELEELKKEYSNPSVQVDLEKTQNVHNVCGLLKLWFSQLPDPLFPFDVYQPLIDVFSSTTDKTILIDFYRKVLNNLPEDRKCIILMLFEYFNCVLKFQEQNKMSPSNLAIVFGPNLLRPVVTDALSLLSKEPNLIIEFMIENYESILTDEKPVSPTLPPSPPSSPS